ncbi:MAG: tetratricopeptide repeat protein [Saprospiraceae bacterium]|nr:tetratricopeptide repeat protein [Saprospiraceae bacterium]
MQLKKLGDIYPDVAASYNGIGFTYFKMGDYGQSLAMYEKALCKRLFNMPVEPNRSCCKKQCRKPMLCVLQDYLIVYYSRNMICELILLIMKSKNKHCLMQNCQKPIQQ